MSNLGKKIEVVSNIGIILSAIVIGVICIKHYLVPYLVPSLANNATSARSNKDFVPDYGMKGNKITVPGIDWDKDGHNLVLCIHSKCHFCTDSAPFYKKLVTQQLENQEDSKSALRIIVVSSESNQTSKAYLDSLGVQIDIDRIKQIDLRSIGISGTPTLLQVDGSGVITNAWVGKLDDSREAEVLAHIR